MLTGYSANKGLGLTATNRASKSKSQTANGQESQGGRLGDYCCCSKRRVGVGLELEIGAGNTVYSTNVMGQIGICYGIGREIGRRINLLKRSVIGGVGG